jgi:Transposase, Mutator family
VLVVSDRAPGVIRAVEECFPRSARQGCLVHRMRNLASKVPPDLWRAAACYQAPSRAIADGIRADYAATLPSAFSCFDVTSRPASRIFVCPLRIAERRARRICLNVFLSKSAGG